MHSVENGQIDKPQHSDAADFATGRADGAQYIDNTLRHTKWVLLTGITAMRIAGYIYNQSVNEKQAIAAERKGTPLGKEQVLFLATMNKELARCGLYMTITKDANIFSIRYLRGEYACSLRQQEGGCVLYVNNAGQHPDDPTIGPDEDSHVVVQTKNGEPDPADIYHYVASRRLRSIKTDSTETSSLPLNIISTAQ